MQTSTFDASIGHTRVPSSISTARAARTASTAPPGGGFAIPPSTRRRSSRTAPRSRASAYPVYQDNRYGLAGGAPVIIPKIYNGKNQHVLVVHLGGNKFGDPSNASSSSVPRAAWRNGDFSDLLEAGSAVSAVRSRDDHGERQRHLRRKPFAGNIIPADRINPVGGRHPEPLPSPQSARHGEWRQQLLHLQ